MIIDLVLASLQALFLSLYGINKVILSAANKKNLWIVVLVAFLGGVVSCILFGSYVKSNIQLFLFLVLMLDQLLRLLNFSSTRWENILVYCAIAFLAYALVYFRWETLFVWIVAPFVFMTFIGMIRKWPSWFTRTQSYFLKAGTLLTLLFVVEPVFISIQQNLKPIATIPISSIINQQNFLLLGVLLLFVLAGFFWKEKSRS